MITDKIIQLALEEDLGLGDITSDNIFTPQDRARAVVNLDTTINVTADFNGVDETVDLLKCPITVPIASGANVAFDLKLHIKADGSAELNVEFDQKIGTRYRNNAFQKVSKTVVDEENTHCAVRTEFALGAVPIAQLRFTKIDLFDVSADFLLCRSDI